MTALNYDSIINKQLNSTNRNRHWFSVLLRLPYLLNSILLLHYTLRSLNKSLSSQLVFAKGTQVTLNDLQLIKARNDLDSLTANINSVIIGYSSLLQIVQDLSKKSIPLKSLYQLNDTINILTETIECYYEILRMLKRAKFKAPINTSDLAKSIASHAANSLEKNMYGD